MYKVQQITLFKQATCFSEIWGYPKTFQTDWSIIERRGWNVVVISVMIGSVSICHLIQMLLFWAHMTKCKVLENRLSCLEILAIEALFLLKAYHFGRRIVLGLFDTEVQNQLSNLMKPFSDHFHCIRRSQGTLTNSFQVWTLNRPVAKMNGCTLWQVFWWMIYLWFYIIQVTDVLSIWHLHALISKPSLYLTSSLLSLRKVSYRFLFWLSLFWSSLNLTE